MFELDYSPKLRYVKPGWLYRALEQSKKYKKVKDELERETK